MSIKFQHIGDGKKETFKIYQNEGMNRMFDRHMRDYLTEFNSFLFNILPFLFLFYLFLPVQIIEDFKHYIIISILNYIIFSFVVTYLVKINKSSITWKSWLYGTIISTGFVFLQDYKKVVFFTLTIMTIFLIIIFTREVINKAIVIQSNIIKRILFSFVLYVFELLAFFLTMLIILKIMEEFTTILIHLEKTFIIIIIIIITLFFLFYTFRIAIDLLKSFQIMLLNNQKVIIVIFYMVIIALFLLILPDVFYAYFIYDMYFISLEDIKYTEIDFINCLYHSIGAHFNLILNENSTNNINRLLDSNLGYFIKISHAILYRLIEIVFIGIVIGVFVEYFKAVNN